MPMIANCVEFVKRQVEFNRRQYKRLSEKTSLEEDSSSYRRAAEKLPIYERLTSDFENLLSSMLVDIEAFEALKQSTPVSTQGTADVETLLKTPTEIQQSTLAGLPEELIAQLQISDSDRFQWCVVDIINRTPDKTISLEVLLIALYKVTGKIYERADLANRMSRLSRKGVAFPVQGRKAVYTTIPPSEDDLLSVDDEESLP